jgi:hypothetical protein
MPVYIVCHKKRNNPRMDVRICEMKCNMKEECKEFKSHHEGAISGSETVPEGEALGLKAA